MKKAILMLIMLIIILCSCAKIISTETIEIEAKIVETNFNPMWLQPIKTGKLTIFITHPANYEVFLEYEGSIYTMDNKNIYNMCENYNGYKVICDMQINRYANDDVKKEIVSVNKIMK